MDRERQHVERWPSGRGSARRYVFPHEAPRHWAEPNGKVTSTIPAGHKVELLELVLHPIPAAAVARPGMIRLFERIAYPFFRTRHSRLPSFAFRLRSSVQAGPTAA